MKPVSDSELEFDFSAKRVCASCGHSFSGKYCNYCGEEVVVGDSKSLTRILKNLWRAFITLENRLLRTLALIVFKTGQFSLNYIHGVRVPYSRPMSIFLIVNLLYFFFPKFESFHAPLRTQMHFLPHNEVASSMVEEEIDERHTTLADFTVRYDQQSSSLSRLLLILFVFLAALPIAFINHSNHFYFLDHLTVSFEFNSILVFFTQLALPWMFTGLIAGFNEFDISLNFLFNETFYSILAMVIGVLIFYLFEKRVYQQKNRTLWIKSILIVPALFLALQAYRIVLFFIAVITL